MILTNMWLSSVWRSVYVGQQLAYVPRDQVKSGSFMSITSIWHNYMILIL